MQTAKNILYVGPYRQADGWGFASHDYLMSLLNTNHSVSAAPIYLNPSSIADVVDKKILDAEKNRFDFYDLVIQQALPQCMVRIGQSKNIGMLFLENNKLFSDSINNLNSMDELWVTSNKEKSCLQRSGVSTKIRVVSHPLPTQDAILAQESGFRIGFGAPVDDEYKFYFIGEYIQRKNIKDIVAAFHLEFDTSEPVRLVIKTSIPGSSPQAAQEKIKSDFDILKQKLRIRNKFKDEIIITDKVSQEHIFAIHNTCDCFISMSYGEAFCRPAAEALCFGKYVILSEGIGASEFIDKEDHSLVLCQEQPVIVEDTTYVAGLDMYNGYETWSIPSILDLQKYMREAYERRPIVNKDKYLTKFSYTNIGDTLCQFIK